MAKASSPNPEDQRQFLITNPELEDGLGRKEKNKAFTFRFRDPSVIKSLFVKENNKESINLNKLFF